jgi:hypothetical protein
MLLPPDADLARRDPKLPGLGTLLDPETLAARLRRALARDDLGPARVTYVKYHPGVKCLVGYQLPVAGTEVQLYAAAHPADAQRELEKARTRPSVPGPLGPGRVVLDDSAVVVAFFPNDRKVKALPSLADAAARKELLREVVPDRPDLWEGTLQCLAYKPERRYVARLLDGRGMAAVLKVYNPLRYGTPRVNAQAFTPHGPLRLPRRLGHSDRQAALAFEWLPGRALSESLADPQLDPGAVAQVGAALAALHAQEPEGLAPLTRTEEVKSVAYVAEALSFLCPHLAGRAQALARRLAACLTAEPPRGRPIHGDFNATQILLTGDAVAVLDFDAAARGDPALDLGTFVAYLERHALYGTFSSGRVEALKEALLAGYRAPGDPSLPARVRLYTAIGVFYRLNSFRYWEPHWRGVNPFRYWEPHWPERAEAFLGRAEQLSREGGPRP